MNKQAQTHETIRDIFLVLALVGSLLAFYGSACAIETADSEKTGAGVKQEEPSKKAPPAVAPLAGIQVAFKLDPRLTASLYMGERWVTPPTYTRVHEGKGATTVEARAIGLDASGMARNIKPQWITADPEMVAIIPNEGNEVKITVKRAGQTSLKVATPDISKELLIKATYKGNSMLLEISQ